LRTNTRIGDIHDPARSSDDSKCPPPAKTGPREGDAYWFYGDLAIVRSPEGALPVIIEHHIGPGASAPLHVHTAVDDSFYLVSGELALPHTLHVMSPEEAVLLQTHDGPDFLNFIRAVGIPASQPKPDLATMDFEAMNVIAGQTGQPVIGPPMSEDEAAAIVSSAGTSL
jgi:hypothetical protein